MKTNIRATWSTVHPSVAADEVGYGTIVNLASYVLPTFYLPDEVEDYLSLKIQRAKLHLHLRDPRTETGGFIGSHTDPASCLILYTARTGDTTPTSAHTAKTSGMSVEEYINGQIAGDGRRNFRFLTPMKFWIQKPLSEFDDGPGVNTSFSTNDIKFDVDLTRIMQQLLTLEEEITNPDDAMNAYLLMYSENGHVTSLSPFSDSSYFQLEVDWNYKSSQNANKKGTTALVPLAPPQSDQRSNRRYAPGWAGLFGTTISKAQKRRINP
jgi:hypothetical protein